MFRLKDAVTCQTTVKATVADCSTQLVQRIRHITVPEMHHNSVSSGSGFCSMNTNIYKNECLNPWHILAETGTRRHIIMMHFGNGHKPNGHAHCLKFNSNLNTISTLM